MHVFQQLLFLAPEIERLFDIGHIIALEGLSNCLTHRYMFTGIPDKSRTKLSSREF